MFSGEHDILLPARLVRPWSTRVALYAVAMWMEQWSHSWPGSEVNDIEVKDFGVEAHHNTVTSRAAAAIQHDCVSTIANLFRSGVFSVTKGRVRTQLKCEPYL